MKAFFREIIVTALLAVVIFLVVNTTLQTSVVVGASMEPSFHEGERIIINKVAYSLSDPARGDVIIFKPPGAGSEDYIKRIIALPGDTVEVKSGTTYVNGSPLEEPYILAHPQYTVPEMKVDDGSYFVLGDNRRNSNDSHTGWVVPRGNIVGKAWINIWPPDNWGPVPDYNLAEELKGSPGD
ncbi:signal peptidase I [Chloroflexota bacterium]